MDTATTTFRGAKGRLIAADVAGPADGQPLILLHGGGQTRGSWQDTTSVLGGLGYRVYSLDARGHGESEYDPEGDYTIGAFADDLRAVIKQVGGRPFLIGASLGGIISLVVAGEDGPDAAAGVVLVDVAVSTDPYGVKRIQDFMKANPDGFASLDEAADAVAGFATDRPRPKSTRGLERNLRLRDGRWFWHWDPAFLECFHQSHLASTQRLEAAARGLRVPVLLVHAAHSEVIGPKEIEQLHTLVPHAEYVRVDDASHMVVGDRNSAFNRAIVAFLSTHGSVAGTTT